MPFLVSDVTTNRSREMLQDPNGPNERWSDTLLISFLNDGVQYIFQHRPDSQLTGPYVLTTAAFPFVTAIGDTVPIADKYLDALAEYVAARAFATDARDRMDKSRADYHMQQCQIKAGMPTNQGTAGRDEFAEQERAPR